MKAVSRYGEPIPWYTYPCVNFLENRSYDGRVVLEFGGGQSTLWWASKAAQVVTFEGSYDWFEKIKDIMPGNVDLHYVPMENKVANIDSIKELLEYKNQKYDVIVIDGMYRYEMIAIALAYLTKTGMIICDDAEGYSFQD